MTTFVAVKLGLTVEPSSTSAVIAGNSSSSVNCGTDASCDGKADGIGSFVGPTAETEGELEGAELTSADAEFD